MKKNKKAAAGRENYNDLAERFRVLSYKISGYANCGLSRLDFLKKVLKMLLHFTGCTEIELWLKDFAEQKNFEIACCGKKSFVIENKHIKTAAEGEPNLKQLGINIMNGRFDASLPFFTARGSFWIAGHKNRGEANNLNLEIDKDLNSLILIPIINGNQRVGLLKLLNPQNTYATKETVELFENFTQSLGISLLNQRTQAALRERVKELTCMYGIAQAASSGALIDEIMQTAAELLPPAWQYPAFAHGRIILDGKIYATSDLIDSPFKLSSDIIIKGEKRGVIEVMYSEETAASDEGPFLKEERKLIDNISKALAFIIEQKQAEEERVRLKEQIRHADRLATIGQLAAGVAHELNEPLSNILGFAQLINKNVFLPRQIEQDVEKIVNASLHAREIVRKLLLFSRQLPTKMMQVDLNRVVEDGLYFLESRCAKEGVKLIRLLGKEIPNILADPDQLTQVLVNLTVNAIQAMPDGGTLKVETAVCDNNIVLTVEDTGQGMSQEVLKKVFLPFFTTKEVGQGTGLGLPVVHGIVTAHGGSIKIDSKPGQGTRFEIRFPQDQSLRKGEN